MLFPLAGKRVYVAGHDGMVGSALLRRLACEDCEVLTAPRDALDLRDQSTTRIFIANRKPDAIFLAAARVGGILANSTYPADFLADNLLIGANVIDAAFRAGTRKLLYLGSSCIYPRDAPQPIPEEALLTGPLEPTNEAYAIAKIAGLKLVQAYRRQHGAAFIAAMPTNLYGHGQSYDLAASHVIPALLRKAHEAKISGAAELTIWGSGTPRREFLHVDDCADALVHLMQVYDDDSHINVGFGEDIAIIELAVLIADVVGFTGRIIPDPSKPDGTPRKLLDSRKLRGLGWSPSMSLRDGLADTYRRFVSSGGSAG